MRTELYKREWLNDQGTAFLELSFGTRNDERGYGYGSVKMADCSRVVTLDFAYYKKKEQRAALKKLNKMLKAITEARDFVAANLGEE